MKHWMFRCDSVSEKLSYAMDTPLPLGQRMAIRMHLWMCKYCALVNRQLKMLRRLGRHDGSDAPPDDTAPRLSKDTRRRIKAALQDLS